MWKLESNADLIGVVQFIPIAEMETKICVKRVIDNVRSPCNCINHWSSKFSVVKSK